MKQKIGKVDMNGIPLREGDHCKLLEVVNYPIGVYSTLNVYKIVKVEDYWVFDPIDFREGEAFFDLFKGIDYISIDSDNNTVIQRGPPLACPTYKFPSFRILKIN
jgi:hypothetical protein